jgi:hypothetical protein
MGMPPLLFTRAAVALSWVALQLAMSPAATSTGSPAARAGTVANPATIDATATAPMSHRLSTGGNSWSGVPAPWGPPNLIGHSEWYFLLDGL